MEGVSDSLLKRLLDQLDMWGIGYAPVKKRWFDSNLYQKFSNFSTFFITTLTLSKDICFAFQRGSYNYKIDVYMSSMDGSLWLFNLQIIVFEPFVGITSVIVINHLSNLCRIVPEVAESSRKVIGFRVLFVNFVAQPSGKQSEAFSNIFAVRVYKSQRRDDSKLY